MTEKEKLKGQGKKLKYLQKGQKINVKKGV